LYKGIGATLHGIAELGAMLWERFDPKVSSYVPLMATLLLLPITWLKFTLPSPSPEADQDDEPVS
jgi:hypothetical protein